ncbi:hypothetical protein ACFQJC_09365 [Haloferax namakaokahaiae]|uniref:Uncharacterized protein n=1 Tax=Haloferax namakaokahaiae TaxID=1748331 RepID=A0ABD5ZFR0_9EURY
MSTVLNRDSSGWVRVVTARETLVLFVLLVLVWALGFYELVPIEIWVIDFPALVAAFFLDTLASNEFGIRENSVFYPALVVCLYLQALVLVAGVRWLRSRTKL